MKRLGKTAEFGIPEDETGIFVSEVSYTGEIQEIEQKDKIGNVQGLILHGAKVNFEMTGEVPHTEGSAATAGAMLGSSIELNNQCPDDQWLDGEKPNATTTVLKSKPYKRSREAVAERSFTGTIYPFDSSTSAANS